MQVQVDESRDHQVSRSIDRLRGGGAETGTDRLYPSILDQDVDELVAVAQPRIAYEEVHVCCELPRWVDAALSTACDEWGRLDPLQDVQTARAVYEVNEAPIIVADIVALDTRRAVGHRRHEGGDLPRRMRIGDIYNSQAVREPGDWNFRAAHLFTELM